MFTLKTLVSRCVYAAAVKNTVCFRFSEGEYPKERLRTKVLLCGAMALWSQKEITAFLKNKQLLPFVFPG